MSAPCFQKVLMQVEVRGGRTCGVPTGKWGCDEHKCEWLAGRKKRPKCMLFGGWVLERDKGSGEALKFPRCLWLSGENAKTPQARPLSP